MSDEHKDQDFASRPHLDSDEPATRYPHIALTTEGTPVLEGTRMKVLELVNLYWAYGWSPEALHVQLPHLPLGYICSALAYYWDHAEAFGEALRKQLDRTDALRQAAAPQQEERIKALRARASR